MAHSLTHSKSRILFRQEPVEVCHPFAKRPRSVGTGRAELLSIAVAKGRRKMNIGTRLIGSLKEHLRSTGVSCLEVVVGAMYPEAVAFYERSGFTKSREVEVHKGEPSLCYRARL